MVAVAVGIALAPLFSWWLQLLGQRTHEYLGYALNVLLARIHGCAPVGCRTPVCTFFPLKHKSVSIFPKAVAAAFR